VAPAAAAVDACFPFLSFLSFFDFLAFFGLDSPAPSTAAPPSSNFRFRSDPSASAVGAASPAAASQNNQMMANLQNKNKTKMSELS
jgi:hypothetical protein